MSWNISPDINNGYPYLQPYIQPYTDITPPFPDGIWRTDATVNGGYPYLKPYIQPYTDITPPYPNGVWVIKASKNNGYPYLPFLPLEKPSGAFMNAHDLEYAYIPLSCKKIGEWAFTNTKLRRVKISEDCEYYSTSFPPDCEVEFYGGGGEYGQLLDSEGYEIIDADGARIYVKE